MWYKVDFNRLVLLLLPTFLRKPVLFGYVKALVSPVESLHYNWTISTRNFNLNKISYNSQKCYLRKALNDIADYDLRRIYINEVPVLDENYLYQPDENLDFFLDTMFLDLDYTAQGEQVDFVVFVPAAVWLEKENEIIATLEFYTLAGKTYKIIQI
jgi:hypothetical protein